MSASVNNIAATFSKAPTKSSSPPSSSSSSSLNQTVFAHPISPKPISISWNPHTTLPRSHKSSLLSLYGPPGPPPTQSPISTVHRTINHHCSLAPPLVGQKLPNLTLSFLNRNQKVQTTTLSSLSKSKRLVIVAVSAAFSPGCSGFLKRVGSEKCEVADLIACVAVNDVFVMKAWGETLAVGEKFMMLSDGDGELSRALGVPLDFICGDRLGLGGRSRRFWLSSLNGVISSFSLDLSDD